MPLRFKFTALLCSLALSSLACNFLTERLSPPAPSEQQPISIPPTTPSRSQEQSQPTPDNPYPGPNGLGDVYFPTLGNGGYDALHYSIFLQIDVAANYVQGQARLELQTTQRLTSLNLELTGLSIDRIAVDGSESPYSRQGSELTVYLPRQAEVGELLLIEIAYQGVPGPEVADLPLYSSGWIHYGDGIAVAGEPTGASVWYPVNEHPADKATYTFSVTVDSEYTVAANGHLQEAIETNGQTTYTWQMEYPIAPYLTTIAVADFDLEETETHNGILVRNYFGAGVPEPVRDDFARTPEMIDYFETLFGPYPYDVYGVVVHDTPLNFALETATLSVFGNSFTDEYVVVHELAHQWFGNAVGLAQWRDIWLNEGFASYASDLWLEHAYGRKAMDDSIRYNYESLAAYSVFSQGLTADPGEDWLFDYASVYVRGGLALHALRLELGDAVFFEALQTYAARFGGGTATTADLIGVVEEVAGRDLSDFFDAWLYQTDLPDIPQMDLRARDYQE